MKTTFVLIVVVTFQMVSGCGWAVEYRFTHPADMDAAAAIDSFMKAWPANSLQNGR